MLITVSSTKPANKEEQMKLTTYFVAYVCGTILLLINHALPILSNDNPHKYSKF